MSGTSLDIDFLTLRNVTAYKPDNSFVADGNILIVGENGQLRYTSSISTFNISTLSAQNIIADNIYVASTISTTILNFNNILNSEYDVPPNSLGVKGGEIYFGGIPLTGSYDDAFWQSTIGNTNAIIPINQTVTVSTGKNLIVASSLIVKQSGAFITGNSYIYGELNVASTLVTSTLTSNLGLINSLSTNVLSTNLINMTNGLINGYINFNDTINLNNNSINNVYYIKGIANQFLYMNQVDGTIGLTNSNGGISIDSNANIITNPNSYISTNTIQMTNGQIIGLNTITMNASTFTTNGGITAGQVYDTINNQPSRIIYNYIDTTTQYTFQGFTYNYTNFTINRTGLYIIMIYFNINGNTTGYTFRSELFNNLSLIANSSIDFPYPGIGNTFSLTSIVNITSPGTMYYFKGTSLIGEWQLSNVASISFNLISLC